MAHDAMESPVDIDADDAWTRDEPGLGLATGAIIVATLFLLLTNAVSIRDWVDEQTPSDTQAAMAERADEWLATTEAIGLAGPRRWLHGQWKAAESLTFGEGEASGG